MNYKEKINFAIILSKDQTFVFGDDKNLLKVKLYIKLNIYKELKGVARGNAIKR